MTAREKIMPPLVLTLICVISSALLVIVYNLTYVDNTGVVTEKLKGGLAEIYGSSSGFEMIKNSDGTVKTYEGVDSILSDGNGSFAFEITADGYSKRGLHLLIGLDSSGAVCGISVLAIGETPGLGTRVMDRGFLDQFIGVRTDDFQADSITGATYSSKGIKNAVSTAVNAYSQLKGEDVSE